MKIGLAKLGMWISGFWIIFLVAMISQKTDSFLNLSPNEWGDFVAGAFGPLALLWLVLGFFQQGRELANSVSALTTQAKQLENSVKEQAQISKATQKQLLLLEKQISAERDDSAYDAFQRYADRMERLREYEMKNPDVRKIWEGGPEHEALQTFEYPEHFYFAKMLLQANESIYLAFQDKELPTDGKGFTLDGWRENFKTDLAAPSFRKIWDDWKIVRHSYDPRFQDEVKKLINSID